MRPTADQFIAGKPAEYVGFDGKLYIATYFTGQRNKLGVGHLQIATPTGAVMREPLMSEAGARSFFANLDAVAEAA